MQEGAPPVSVAGKLSRDGWLLLVTRCFRMFAYGLLSVVLVLYLADLGLNSDVGIDRRDLADVFRVGRQVQSCAESDFQNFTETLARSSRRCLATNGLPSVRSQ